MTNVGVYPLQAGTLVGSFRGLIGDVNSVPLSPVVAGFSDYTYFSDADILAFLLNANNSVKRAVGNAYMQWAAAATMQAAVAQSADMKVDITARATGFRQLAQIWFTEAATDDALDRNNDSVMIVVSATPKLPIFSPLRTPLIDDYIHSSGPFAGDGLSPEVDFGELQPDPNNPGFFLP